MKLKMRRVFELLGIIFIPLIFVLITIPQLAIIIKDYRKNTFLTEVKTIAATAEEMYFENRLLNIDALITCDDIIDINDEDYESCSVYIDNNIALVSVAGKNKYKGMRVCNSTRTNASFVDSCDDICVMNDLVETKVPYELNDYESCMSYTKEFFVKEKNYTNNELKLFCKGKNVNDWSFSDNIEYMINKGYSEKDLVLNNVIKGKIHDICIPNHIHIACYKYNILGEKGNKYIEITNYDDRCGSNIVIPEEIDGFKVEGIGENAFSNSNIYSVKFPSTIRYISNNSFRGAGDDDLLRGARLSGALDLSNLINLEKIDSFAFADNKITEVKFPSSVKHIGGYAFSENEISGVLDLSNTKINSISEYAFSSNKIINIKLPENISSIGFTAFAGNEIVSLDLSSYLNLTTIGIEAFAANKITNIKLPKNISVIKSDAFSYNLIGGELDLSLYDNLKNINGFQKNLITSIKLGKNVENIESYAFASNDISNLDLNSYEQLSMIGNSSFINNNLMYIKLPKNIEVIENNAFFKNSDSNVKLNNIINLSNKEFNWNQIVGIDNANTCNFITGICENIIITNK